MQMKYCIKCLQTTEHGAGDECLVCGQNKVIQKEIGDKKCWVRVGTWDENVFKEVGAYFKKIVLKPEDNWLDIGGNIGSFCRRVADKVATVVAYEPDVDNFELLKKNNEGIPNVVPVNKAIVGNDDKSRLFFLNQQTSKSTHSFFVKRGRKCVSVFCENINSVIEKYKINKMKIDCEGSEHEILTSLKDYSPIKEIFLEFHINVLCKGRNLGKYNDVVNILKKNFNYVEYPEDVKKNWTVYLYARKDEVV